MLIFALLIFTLFIQLTVASCKDEIQLLITLGASPQQLKSYLMKQFFPSNIVITVIALILVSVLQFLMFKVLQQQNIFLSPFISLYTLLISIVVLIVLWWVNHSTIKKYIAGK